MYALEKSKNFIFMHFKTKLFSFTPTFCTFFNQNFTIPAPYLSFPLLPLIFQLHFLTFSPKNMPIFTNSISFWGFYMFGNLILIIKNNLYSAFHYTLKKKEADSSTSIKLSLSFISLTWITCFPQ